MRLLLFNPIDLRGIPTANADKTLAIWLKPQIFQMSDSEDIVNMALQVAGVEVAEIAIEQTDGSVKSSFRSRCALDCSQLAAAFGGGGHKAAAGATFDCGLDEALAQMTAKTVEMYAALA